MEGRSVWWRTNLDAGARILAADPGLGAGGALTAEEVEALTVGPGLAHILDLAASPALTPDRKESPTPNLQRSPGHTLANLKVPPRAKKLTLTQTLASHAQRADPKSKPNVNPGVVPRRNPPIRSLEATRAPVQRVEMRNKPQNHLLARTPSPQQSARPPAPDPDQPLKTDQLLPYVLKKNDKSHPRAVSLRCLQSIWYLLALIWSS